MDTSGIVGEAEIRARDGKAAQWMLHRIGDGADSHEYECAQWLFLLMFCYFVFMLGW